VKRERDSMWIPASYQNRYPKGLYPEKKVVVVTKPKKSKKGREIFEPWGYISNVHAQ
jgi:hypothetical protein